VCSRQWWQQQQWQRGSGSNCRGIGVAATASPHVRAGSVSECTPQPMRRAAGPKSTENVKCFFRALPTPATWVGGDRGAAQRCFFPLFSRCVRKKLGQQELCVAFAGADASGVQRLWLFSEDGGRVAPPQRWWRRVIRRTTLMGSLCMEPGVCVTAPFNLRPASLSCNFNAFPNSRKRAVKNVDSAQRFKSRRETLKTASFVFFTTREPLLPNGRPAR
jgi:hypothetical protein